MTQVKPKFQFIRNSVLLSGMIISSGFSLLWNMQSINAQLDGTDEPVPPNSRPLASRGECDQPDTYDMPLTLIAGTSDDAWVTTNSTTRLYVYIPFTLRERDPGMFTLRADSGRIVDQQQFLNVPNGGILEISITQPLQIGQTYRWFFETFCNDPTMDNSTDYSFSMSNSIRREAVDFPGNHLYDQLSLAADRKRQGSSTDWDNLLESLGLSHLRDQPIIRQ